MTTSAPDELYNVLEAFKPALKSVDIRCVAVTLPSEEYWQNLITSIIFSDKTVDEVKNEQKTIPKIRNNYFSLFYDAVPFDYYALTKISEGQFRIPVTIIGGNRIQFRKSDLFKLKVKSSKEPIDGIYNWMLSATDSGSKEKRVEFWSIAKKQSVFIKRFNVNSIPKMVEQYLKIKYNSWAEKDLEIAIRPPATIEKVQFTNNNLKLFLRNLQN